MGYLLVSAVLVVTLGPAGRHVRPGPDLQRRLRGLHRRLVLLSFDPFNGAGALWLIGWRMLQAVGGSMLMANSAAILTDAFPPEQRGMALGINQIAGLAGQFLGLVAGGLLAAMDWRAVFWVNVPIGIFGTLWAYRSCATTGERHRARIDWWGNITFAVGLGAVLIAITYGIQPYQATRHGLGQPGGARRARGRRRAAGRVRRHRAPRRRADVPARPVPHPGLHRRQRGRPRRVPIARGGLQFMLIIWLQGIWLPLHGYDYADTRCGRASSCCRSPPGSWSRGRSPGYLSDRFGAAASRPPGWLVFGVSASSACCCCRSTSPTRPSPLLSAQRDRQRHVRRAQHLLDHGQRPGPPARRRLGHALDVPELRHGAVDRRVLLPDDRRAGQHACRRR